jgi:hypothetical protein
VRLLRDLLVQLKKVLTHLEEQLTCFLRVWHSRRLDLSLLKEMVPRCLPPLVVSYRRDPLSSSMSMISMRMVHSTSWAPSERSAFGRTLTKSDKFKLLLHPLELAQLISLWEESLPTVAPRTNPSLTSV